MKLVFESFWRSKKRIFENRLNILLTIIPLILGILLYFVGAYFLWGPLADWSRSYIDSLLQNSIWGSFLYYFIVVLFSIAFYFLLNWTFVLVVSIIASPFSDILSERIERQELGQELGGIDQIWRKVVSGWISIVTNEIKKIALIAILGLLAFIFGQFPPLLFLSVIVSSLLLAIQFVDYSWSRHKLSFGDCVRDLKRHFIPYVLSGLIWLAIVMVPIVNLFVIPLATAYYTILWNRLTQRRLERS